MIFSKFFKPAWQHKDSTTRIHAIETELSAENGEHFTVLQGLALNDENELVRRAALLKLNSFSIWFEHSKSNSVNTIREFAQQQVELILHGKHQISLDVKDKKQFLKQPLKTSLLESWLKEEHEAEVVVELFKLLNKPQLLFTVFKQHQDEAVQSQLIALVEDVHVYEKLIKVAASPKISDTLNQYIQLEKEKAEKPQKLTKSVQLLLSKFLALKDSKDYQETLDKQAQFESEWQQLQSDLDCLSDAQKTSFKDKYVDIKQQVKKHLAPLAEAFEQEKIAIQLENARRSALEQLEEQINQLEQAITESIFENTEIDEINTTEKLSDLNEQVAQSALLKKDKDRLSNKISAIKNKLSKLSEVAQAVTKATHLISKMSQVALPETVEELNEKSDDFYAWCKDWQQVERSAGSILPDSVKAAFKEIKSAWKKALLPLEQAQKKQFHVAGRKISDVKRLINLGKYNAAFGVFKKASSLYLALNKHQQNKLKRDYAFVKDKLEDLSDWEHYVATPKKQELVNQIERLATEPLDNPAEQAKKVKEFRRLWNSLGHAEDELESALNEQFNKFSELAFAPCRLYFAEQEQIREKHLVARQSIIQEARNAALSCQEWIAQHDWKKLESELNRVKQLWRDAGEVDRNVYQEMNTEFKAIIEPLKNAVLQRHQQSIDEKNAIIAKAELLLEEDDVFQASNDIKQLQQEWKLIGYSGPKQENLLWKKFRAINDTLFSRRSERQNEQKQQSQQQESELVSKIEDILQVLDSTSIDSIKKVTRNLNKLKSSVENTGVKFKRSLQLINKELSALKGLQQQFTAQQEKQSWAVVFEAMSYMVENDVATFDNFDSLPNEWQKRLKDANQKSPASYEDRLDKTLLLEILATKESPKEEQNRRLALQLEVMQQQLNSGQLDSIEQGLAEWLNIGKLAEQDLPLIKRAKAIFTD